MNHDEYKEKISALLDGELTDAERTDVLAHLETCEACRSYLAELTALHDALGDMEPIDAPEGFAEGVMARLHAESAPRAWAAREPKKRAAWRRWAALAACAAVVVLAVTTLPNMRMGGASGATADSAASGSVSATESMMVQSTMTTASSAPAAAAADTEESAETPEMQTDLYKAAGIDEYAAPEAAVETEKGPATATAEAAPPVLTLIGDGAAEWLEENAEPLGDGRWLVTVEAVNALPDTLELVAEADLQQPVDGTLVITLGTTENPR